jgi:AcrR family transcriptional regulator
MNNLSKDDITKQAILEAAGRVFQKWGVNKTTMEDIAREAGKGKSTLYYYYSSKDEIFDAVLLSEIDKVLKETREAIEREDNVKDKFRAYINTVFEGLKKAANFYSIVVGEIRHMNKPMQKLREVYDQSEMKLIKSILKFGADKGEIVIYEERELNTIAYILLSSVRSLQMDLFIENKSGTQEIIDTMLQILSKGLIRM